VKKIHWLDDSNKFQTESIISRKRIKMPLTDHNRKRNLQDFKIFRMKKEQIRKKDQSYDELQGNYYLVIKEGNFVFLQVPNVQIFIGD
jgi:hypothetical protein